MTNWESKLPPATQEVNEGHLDAFFKTMFKRHEIWYNKNVQKKPWPHSDDDILNNYKFCNVYRMLDRTTQYLINKSTNVETDFKQILFNTILFRVVNSPETIDEIGGFPNYKTLDFDELVKVFGELEEAGMKTLNDDAYKINTYIWPGVSRWKAYLENIVKPYWLRLTELSEKLQMVSSGERYLSVMKIHGVGNFLMHEIYQDLCDLKVYGRGQEMRTAFKMNKNDWTNAGPGAQLGLRLIFPAIKQHEDCIKMLRDIAPDRLAELGNFRYVEYWKYGVRSFITPHKPNITLHEIEFWLCEYAKYWKMQIGAGKQRKKYMP